MSMQPQGPAGQAAQSERAEYEVLSSGKTLYKVHSVWLGWPGMTLPGGGIPYLGAAAAAVTLVPAVIVIGIIGVRGWQHYAAALAIAVIAAFIVVRNSSSDRPAGALLATWWHETSAPRPGEIPDPGHRVAQHVLPVRALPSASSSPRAAGHPHEEA